MNDTPTPIAIGPQTLVTVLLDRSHSMHKIKSATIEGFNAFISSLQTEPDADISFTFLQFDDQSLDKVCVAIPIREARFLTETTFVPRGRTPLIEAAIKTIIAVDESLHKYGAVPPKVVITIQTDGEENCSGAEHSWEGLKALIAEKQAQGWQFTFLGAGIDAYNQGARMGIEPQSTMSYDSLDRGATRHAFAASASSARDFAAGRAVNATYSMQDRRLSGDSYVPHTLHETMSQQPPAGHTVSARLRLDLTTATTTEPQADVVKAPVL